jgi:hypothetical protein
MTGAACRTQRRFAAPLPERQRRQARPAFTSWAIAWGPQGVLRPPRCHSGRSSDRWAPYLRANAVETLLRGNQRCRRQTNEKISPSVRYSTCPVPPVAPAPPQLFPRSPPYPPTGIHSAPAWRSEASARPPDAGPPHELLAGAHAQVPLVEIGAATETGEVERSLEAEAELRLLRNRTGIIPTRRRHCAAWSALPEAAISSGGAPPLAAPQQGPPGNAGADPWGQSHLPTKPEVNERLMQRGARSSRLPSQRLNRHGQ